MRSNGRNRHDTKLAKNKKLKEGEKSYVLDLKRKIKKKHFNSTVMCKQAFISLGGISRGRVEYSIKQLMDKYEKQT